MPAPCALCLEPATAKCRCGAWYCSRACQAAAWKAGHWRACKRLAKAAALAGRPARRVPDPGAPVRNDDAKRCPGCRGSWDPNEARSFATCCGRNLCMKCAGAPAYACPICGSAPPPSSEAALNDVRKHCDGDNAAALCFLAQTYRGGGLGLARSPERAHELFSRAADLGDPTAMVNLADLVRGGRGCDANPIKAAELLRCAADKGDAAARFNLASRHYAGDGVDRDEAEACRLYAAAAAAGLTSAEFALGALHAIGGDGVPQDLAAARKWYGRAAAKGDDDARVNLERLPKA